MFSSSINCMVLPPKPIIIMAVPMEDCNMVVADCIVICCCSQCLILQIIIFVLLKLPCKLIRKTKEYAKKKLGSIKRINSRRNLNLVKIETREDYDDEVDRIRMMMMSSIELIDEDEGQYECGFQCCMEEVEKVLEGLSQKGEFAFGSFWGSSSSSISSSDSKEISARIISSLSHSEEISTRIISSSSDSEEISARIISSSSCLVPNQLRDLIFVQYQ